MYPANTTSGFLCSSLSFSRRPSSPSSVFRARIVARAVSRALRASSRRVFRFSRALARTFATNFQSCGPRAAARTSPRSPPWCRARTTACARPRAGRTDRRGSVGSSRGATHASARGEVPILDRGRATHTTTRDARAMSSDAPSTTAHAEEDDVISVGALIDDLKVRARASGENARARARSGRGDDLI